MNDLDLNHLKTFVIVVESGSVTAGAKRLFRTQPAISAQLAQLEEAVDMKLFERRGRQLALTREGAHFHEVVRKQLQEFEEKVAQVTKGELVQSGVLRIAAIPDLGHQLILPVIKQLQSNYPQVQCVLSFGPSELVEEHLLNRHYDLGFVTEVRAAAHFHAEKIVDVEHVVVAHRDYIRKHKNDLRSAEQMLDAPWIDCVEDWRLCRLWLKANYPNLVERLSKRRPAFVVDTFRGLAEAARLGLGLTVVPHYLVRDDLKKGVLERVLKKSKPLFYPVFVIQHANHYRRQVERVFLDMLKSNPLV